MRNRLLTDLVMTALATLVAAAVPLAPTGPAAAQETHDHAEHGAMETRDYAALWDAASAKEQAAAHELIAATRDATQRWSDVDVALADGFSPNRGGVGPVHYRNVANRRDDGVLDPNHPEALVYLQRPNGDPILLGAVYVVTRVQERPTPAGDLAAWHVHNDPGGERPRRSAPDEAPLGAPTNGGGCHHPDLDPGCADVRGGMLHVWVYSGVRDPFADPMFASMGTPAEWRSKLYDLVGSGPRAL